MRFCDWQRMRAKFQRSVEAVRRAIEQSDAAAGNWSDAAATGFISLQHNTAILHLQGSEGWTQKFSLAPNTLTNHVPGGQLHTYASHRNFGQTSDSQKIIPTTG